MSTNAAPEGTTERIDPSEATVYIAGVGLVQFASFDVEYEDESDTEDAIDNVRVHYDAPVRGSGSFELMPTSDAIGPMKSAILDRTIGSAVFRLPENDGSDRHKFAGVRITNFGQDDADDGYTYSGDWEADWAIA